MDKFSVSSALLGLGSETLKAAQTAITRIGTENWTPDERQAAGALLNALSALTKAAIAGMEQTFSEQPTVETPQTSEPAPNGVVPEEQPGERRRR